MTTQIELERDRGQMRAERGAMLAFQAGKPFDARSERLLHLLPATLEQEMRFTLRRARAHDRQMDPMSFADATCEMLVNSVLQAYRTRAMAGFDTGSIADLGTPGTLEAIEARLKAAEAGDDKGGWGPITAGMVLADLRKLLIFVEGKCDPRFNKRQRELSASPRRSIDHRVFPVADYLRGARAIACLAEVLREAGRCHNESLSRDAAMLALDTHVHARLGELYNLNVSDVRRRQEQGRLVLSVSLRMKKTGTERIVHIRDEQTIELVEPLLKAKKDAPLFRNEEGRRLDYSGVANALARTCALAVGERGGANILRRSATLRSDGKNKDTASLLGQNGPATSRKFYTPNLSTPGLKLMQQANARSAGQAVVIRAKKRGAE